MSVCDAGQIACPPGTSPACLAGFPVEFSGGAIPTDIGYVRFSSPAVARLGLVADIGKDIVVGTTGGYVIAYHSDGTFLWARKVASVEVPTKPAIADIDGDGVPEIVVGAASSSQNGGGVYVLRNNGTLKCSFTALDAVTGSGNGVYSSPALAHLDRARPLEMQIVFGSWDKHVRALNADCSLWWAKGLSDDIVDTVWSSPAIYDMDNDGQLDVIIGQDSGQGTLPNLVQVGGQMRVFRGNGIGELPGFPIKLDDVVYSSPAIGDLAGTGHPAIVAGYGRCWDMPSCAPGGLTHAVTAATYGWGSNGMPLPGWPYATPNQSSRTVSPALADLDGDGKLETVIGTLVKTTGTDQDGWLHVIRSDGTAYPGWPRQPFAPLTCSTNQNWLTAFGSPIVVDLDGDGKAEIIMSNSTLLVAWDRNGNQLTAKSPAACSSPATAGWQLLGMSSIHGTPTAADIDGDGKIELVVGTASTLGGPIGALVAWRFPNSVAKPDNMPWSQFHANERNTGVYTPDRIFKNGFD
ncbi:MAG: FG-GAP-like repeat-containing protein [Dokdonella sp.]